jgi:hypothetical protein
MWRYGNDVESKNAGSNVVHRENAKRMACQQVRWLTRNWILSYWRLRYYKQHSASWHNAQHLFVSSSNLFVSYVYLFLFSPHSFPKTSQLPALLLLFFFSFHYAFRTFSIFLSYPFHLPVSYTSVTSPRLLISHRTMHRVFQFVL